MVKVLPIASESTQKMLEIPENFPTDLLFDLLTVSIGWLKRLDPARFDAISSVVNLNRLQDLFICGSDLDGIPAFAGRVNGILSAKNSLELLQALLKLTRTTASIAKLIFDYAVIISPQGLLVASKIKYTSWSISGSITLGETLYAFHKPSAEQERYGKTILTLDLFKSTAFLALGLLRLANKPQLRPYILPCSTLLLLLASTSYTAKKVINNLNS